MKTLAAALVAVATLSLAGCAASPTPNYDLRFGDAVRQAREQMILNPNASAGSVAGMDGTSAQETMLLYHGTFRSPPPVTNVINIGGSSAASQ
jgi:hypothetical protein